MELGEGTYPIILGVEFKGDNLCHGFWFNGHELERLQPFDILSNSVKGLEGKNGVVWFVDSLGKIKKLQKI